MSQLFFFILRDTREAGISKYSGLLPKLSPDYFNADRSERFEDIVGHDYQTIDPKNLRNYFRLLSSSNIDLKKSRYRIR